MDKKERTVRTATPSLPKTMDELQVWVLHYPNASLVQIQQAFDSVRNQQFEDLREVVRVREEVMALLSRRLAAAREEVDGLQEHRHSIPLRDLYELQKQIHELVVEKEKALQAKAEAEELDPNTRVLNAETFRRKLVVLMQAEQLRDVRWLCVGFLDYRKFKFINDNLGHIVGDQVLRTGAEVLKKYIRPSDLAGRWGGDEFIFAIAGIQEFQDAYHIADRFKLELEKQEPWIALNPRFVEFPVCVDVGMVCLRLGPIEERRMPEAADKLVTALIDQADKQMYLAKKDQGSHVYPLRVKIVEGELVPFEKDTVS